MKLNPGSAGRLTGFIFSPLNTLNNTEKTNTLHHEEHEGNEVKPGSAGRLTVFMHFAFGDQSRVPRDRWITAGGTPSIPIRKITLSKKILQYQTKAFFP